MRYLAIGISALLLSARKVSTNSPDPSGPGSKEQIGAISGMIVTGAIANDLA